MGWAGYGCVGFIDCSAKKEEVIGQLSFDSYQLLF